MKMKYNCYFCNKEMNETMAQMGVKIKGVIKPVCMGCEEKIDNNAKYYYSPEIPEILEKKDRFQNIILYKCCKFIGGMQQLFKIQQDVEKMEEILRCLDCGSTNDDKKELLYKLFDIIQETYTMIENSFDSNEIYKANIRFLEKKVKSDC